ncbi:hypothetical protein HELRODRAFT_174697 [Helobdella robusta]|uniref:Uncharacterized protein n=1 Tax=Helobdella robusta TaxID=6412 RepID=T1F8D7_HELRO|nr:hypothetical protein HELRODRAFT_174697 [Helobdella robusta]ESO01721.1 hypothetical protein HELRODRAFT_174697 [Helobdella robusta]
MDYSFAEAPTNSQQNNTSTSSYNSANCQLKTTTTKSDFVNIIAYATRSVILCLLSIALVVYVLTDYGIILELQVVFGCVITSYFFKKRFERMIYGKDPETLAFSRQLAYVLIFGMAVHRAYYATNFWLSIFNTFHTLFIGSFLLKCKVASQPLNIGIAKTNFLTA